MKLLEGKVAVVTGAARGIGKEIALKYASEGADIAFTDLVIDENGKKTEEEIAALGVRCKGYPSDASDFAATEAVVEEIKKDFGRIDVLVNNAGITMDGLMLREAVGQGHFRQSQVSVQLYPCRSPHNDASEIRLDHQYGVGGWRAWQRRPG